MDIQRFAFPTTIHFGAGARKLVAAHLSAQGIKRPLIVTDRGIAPLPMLTEFVAGLQGLDAGVYSAIWGNPVKSQVDGGASAYRAHRADAVIGLGGGAALDVAKAVALMATNTGDILEYAWDHPQVRSIDHALPYFVALPTTAGTGSEVGRSSVISDDSTHIKKIIFSPKLLAKVVFADPEMTLDLPPHITAATGMDALTHNVESYLSPAYHPLCDGIALEGVRIAAAALRRAVREPHNLAARSDMLMSSMMGAIAFQKDLGAVHSCAHALSTVADLHHGLANGIMIDHVMRFNLPSAVTKMAELAHVVGAARQDRTAQQNAEAFVAWLTALKAELAIPATLSAYDAKRRVTRADVAALVDVATHDICHQTNPRPCGKADFERIFAEAIG
jgi:alcohol dehydrogenase class IV